MDLRLQVFWTRERGAVALEFLFLFPLVVAMLYGAAAYGILFFGKYQMQKAVEQATSAVLSLDRSRYTSGELEAKVSATASAVLVSAGSALPSAFSAAIESSECSLTTVQDLELLSCSLTLNNADDPVVPQLEFGLLGSFPPMPERLKVESSVAF